MDKLKSLLHKLFPPDQTEERILAALEEGAKYGLDLCDAIGCSFGSLYPALNQLEGKGLISWRWGDVQEGSGGARRKYYYLKR